MAATFPVFTEWAAHVIDVGMLSGRLATVFGWPIHVTEGSQPTSLRNYPMQSNGAEMLRLACCLATERSITVCAPVHDALLVEATVAEIEHAIAGTRDAMAAASRAVLDGLEITTDVTVIEHPNRYTDPRGAVMWQSVIDLLERYP